MPFCCPGACSFALLRCRRAPMSTLAWSASIRCGALWAQAIARAPSKNGLLYSHGSSWCQAFDFSLPYLYIYIYTYACNVSRCVFYTTATTATSNTKKSNPIPTPIQSNPIQIEIQSNPIQYIYIYIQSNPILSNPIQPNPIKSNPIQSSPMQSNPIPIPIQPNPI